MDLKTIIAVAPFLRRIYRRLPRSLRVIGLLIAIVVGARRLFGGGREEPDVANAGDTGVQAEGQTPADG